MARIVMALALAINRTEQRVNHLNLASRGSSADRSISFGAQD